MQSLTAMALINIDYNPNRDLSSPSEWTSLPISIFFITAMPIL